MYSYDIIVIVTLVLGFVSYSCNNYYIILVPWYNYNVSDILIYYDSVRLSVALDDKTYIVTISMYMMF